MGETAFIGQVVRYAIQVSVATIELAAFAALTGLLARAVCAIVKDSVWYE